jgi:hypothetical protein
MRAAISDEVILTTGQSSSNWLFQTRANLGTMAGSPEKKDDRMPGHDIARTITTTAGGGA